jgi:nucleoside 2-deoxyribosyltransferase
MNRSPGGGIPQTVFIMMPFAADFDDVYATVKDSVAAVDESLAVIRLDEIRAAGSITDDLIEEIRKSTLCLADVSDANPNVMWEVGYATALGKPVVAISQETRELAFDIKDVRTLRYNRASLAKTLRDPLTAVLRATLERYLVRRSGLRLEQQQPRLRTIAITGSMAALQASVAQRLEQLLVSYTGKNYHWYVGSYGDTDEAILRYLIESGERSIAVVGYNSYDISERQLSILERHPHISFIDAEREQLPPVPKAPSKRDVLFASRADLVVIIWNGKSSVTKGIIDWFSDTGKDHIVGFSLPSDLREARSRSTALISAMPDAAVSGAGGHIGGEDVVGVPVEGLAGSVIAHGGARIGVPGGYLDVA